MSNEIILNADARLRTGTNKNREIRREDSMVPAVIYGNNEDTKNIKVPLNEITKACESEPDSYTHLTLPTILLV